jgi:hypothetical protein
MRIADRTALPGTARARARGRRLGLALWILAAGLDVLHGGGDAGAAALAGTRDPLTWPFAATSIWNMPIGTGAVYVPAGMTGTPASDVWAGMPQVDGEQIILRPTAPPTPIRYSDAGWTGRDRCNPSTSTVLATVPMPSNYVQPHNPYNNAATFLMSDGKTLWQAQPFTRCTAGQPATSLYVVGPTDLYGDGIAGVHGGSGLSAIGGSLRLGELRPGGQPPRHALKVNVYARRELYRCTTRADCYRWPARTADGYAVGFYGVEGGTVRAMKMGALLALPASLDLVTLGLETEPARMLAWTLQNYGAYIVDDTYGPNFAINAETGADGSFETQFQNDWGFPLEQRVRDNSPWVRDIQRLLRALHVVDNNGPSTIGGGGTPLQPLAPPFGPGGARPSPPTGVAVD